MIVYYFSSITNNTHRFVQRLDAESHRIPLQGDTIFSSEPYLLVTPTYGSGRQRRMVPVQVSRFLREAGNRELCLAVAAAGNRTFGSDFGRAGDVISERLGVPLLHKFELAGNAEDTQIVCAEMERLCLQPV